MKPELNHNATGVKRPFKLEEIWRIRTRIEIQNNLMQLALLNLAIDSKLRSCDLLSLKVREHNKVLAVGFKKLNCNLVIICFGVYVALINQ